MDRILVAGPLKKFSSRKWKEEIGIILQQVTLRRVEQRHMWHLWERCIFYSKPTPINLPPCSYLN